MKTGERVNFLRVLNLRWKMMATNASIKVPSGEEVTIAMHGEKYLATVSFPDTPFHRNNIPVNSRMPIERAIRDLLSPRPTTTVLLTNRKILWIVPKGRLLGGGLTSLYIDAFANIVGTIENVEKIQKALKEQDIDLEEISAEEDISPGIGLKILSTIADVLSPMRKIDDLPEKMRQEPEREVKALARRMLRETAPGLAEIRRRRLAHDRRCLSDHIADKRRELSGKEDRSRALSQEIIGLERKISDSQRTIAEEERSLNQQNMAELRVQERRLVEDTRKLEEMLPMLALLPARSSQMMAKKQENTNLVHSQIRDKQAELQQTRNLIQRHNQSRQRIDHLRNSLSGDHHRKSEASRERDHLNRQIQQLRDHLREKEAQLAQMR